MSDKSKTRQRLEEENRVFQEQLTESGILLRMNVASYA